MLFTNTDIKKSGKMLFKLRLKMYFKLL
jgi:hypothetical protein